MARALSRCTRLEAITLGLRGHPTLIRTGCLLDLLVNRDIQPGLLAGLKHLELQVATMPLYRGESNIDEIKKSLFPQLLKLEVLRLNVIDDLTPELIGAVIGEFGTSNERRGLAGLKELAICFEGELRSGIITESELLRAIPSLVKLKIIQRSQAPSKVEACQKFSLVHFYPGQNYNLICLSLDMPNLCLPPVFLAEFLKSLPLQLAELGLPSIVLKCHHLFLEEVLPKLSNLRKLQLFHSHALPE